MADITSTEYFNGTTSNQYIDVRLKVDIKTTYSTNKSSVTVTLQYKRNNTGNTTYGTGSFSVGFGTLIDTYKNRTITITEHDWVNAASSTWGVSHNDDGTCPNKTVSGSGSIPDTTLTSSSVSGTITFPVIPRPSSIWSLSCDTSYFTGKMSYVYYPKASTFYHKCNISLNIDGSYTAVKSRKLNPISASSQSVTETLSEDELSTIYEALPKAKNGKLRFTLRTYRDSGCTIEVGGGDYMEINLTIPNDTTTQPTATMTLSPVSDISGLSVYAKGLSKVKATFASGAGKYGATIASYKMTVAGKDYGSPYTSDLLSTTGTITVKGTVTDTRGYSRTYSQDITVYDYTTPTLDTLTCSTNYFNGTITHKYTPPNNVFYTRCAITFGSITVKEENHTRASGQQTVSFSLSESELSKIYNALPNSTRGTLKFTFQAFTDSNYSNQIGSVSAKEITLSIPDIDATKPTAKLTHTPVSFLASPFNSLYIKGKSKVCVDLTEGAGKYGAVPVSYSVTVGSQGGTPPYTSEYLSTPSAITITGTVTDSRGFSRTYTDTITPIDYNAPLLLPVSEQSSVIAARCNSAGALDANGTYLLIAAKRSYSKVMASNVQKNYCKIQYRYKVEGGSYSSWVDILAKTASSDEVVMGAVPDVTLDTLTTYVVQIRAIDDVGDSVSTTIFISTEKVYMHKAGSRNSLGIGKYAEDDNVVDIAEDLTTIFRGNVQFKSEAWVELPLGTNVTDSTVNSGRWGGTGVFYRVCAGGKHIYVAFNVSFTTSSSTVRAESSTIPYPPTYDVYALCPVGFSDGSRGFATVSVSPKGRVNIYAVHKLPGATLSTNETVKWIDGYIDYWT